MGGNRPPAAHVLIAGAPAVLCYDDARRARSAAPSVPAASRTYPPKEADEC